MKLDKKEFIEKMFDKGVLIHKGLLDSKEVDYFLFEKIETEADLLVLNEDYMDLVHQPGNVVDWYDLDKYRVDAEKDRNDDLYQNQLQQFRKTTLSLDTSESMEKQELSNLETAIGYVQGETTFTTQSDHPISPSDNFTISDTIIQPASAVTVIISYHNEPHKYLIEDFTNFFSSRYRFLESLLKHRRELEGTAAINRVLGKKEKESVAVIGLVSDIGETKTGNIVLTIEDLTGEIKILISKNKKELFLAAKDIVVDEVIGILGMNGDKIIFAETILWPDIPLTNELKKGDTEEYVIFLSDIHVGSTLFLKEEFTKFLSWIRGEIGSDIQKEIASKVKYVFIAGDLVDGVGIYPSQEEELEIKDINEQYAEFTRLIKQIPTDKKILICPGNHDAVHLAEPQPVFYQEFTPGLFDLPNVTLVTNPSLINIGKTEKFPGFTVLMYHGYSFDYYVANVESIRRGGGYHRSDLIMKFLLKRRHLAPSFTSTPYYPSHKEDPLLIKIIPDFLITGHIHYSSVANYRGITMISGSCWQGKTTFQEKLGHQPEPARVPIVNLKTREVKVLRFG